MNCPGPVEAFYSAHRLYIFKCILKPSELDGCINSAFDKDIVSECTVKECLPCFWTGDQDGEHWTQSGRSSGLDGEHQSARFRDDLQQKTCHVAKSLRDRNQLLLSTDSTWLSVHTVKEGTTRDEQDAAPALVEIAVWIVSFNRTKTWLNYFVTRNEERFLYANIQHKRKWCRSDEHPETTDRPEFHSKKVLTSIWWDIIGVLPLKLVPPSTTIRMWQYCENLDRLVDPIQRKCSSHWHLRFIDENARPCVVNITRE